MTRNTNEGSALRRALLTPAELAFARALALDHRTNVSRIALDPVEARMHIRRELRERGLL